MSQPLVAAAVGQQHQQPHNLDLGEDFPPFFSPSSPSFLEQQFASSSDDEEDLNDQEDEQDAQTNQIRPNLNQVEPYRSSILSPPNKSSSPLSNMQLEEKKNKLLAQIHYYFSDENLSNDDFLLKRVKKDPQGWVKISLLANFKRIQKYRMRLNTLMEILQRSPILEVSENKQKVRRRVPVSDAILNADKRTIVVDNLNPETTTRDTLLEFFSKQGTVEVLDYPVSEKDTAYIRFQTESSAKACEKLSEYNAPPTPSSSPAISSSPANNTIIGGNYKLGMRIRLKTFVATAAKRRGSNQIIVTPSPPNTSSSGFGSMFAVSSSAPSLSSGFMSFARPNSNNNNGNNNYNNGSNNNNYNNGNNGNHHNHNSDENSVNSVLSESPHDSSLAVLSFDSNNQLPSAASNRNQSTSNKSTNGLSNSGSNKNSKAKNNSNSSSNNNNGRDQRGRKNSGNTNSYFHYTNPSIINNGNNNNGFSRDSDNHSQSNNINVGSPSSKSTLSSHFGSAPTGSNFESMYSAVMSGNGNTFSSRRSKSPPPSGSSPGNKEPVINPVLRQPHGPEAVAAKGFVGRGRPINSVPMSSSPLGF